MNITLVEINVQSDKIEKFIEAFRPNQEGALTEEGCVRFDVLQHTDTPTRFTIYEVYRDDDAMLAHKKTTHYLQCVKKLESIMSGDRKKTILTEIMWTH